MRRVKISILGICVLVLAGILIMQFARQMKLIPQQCYADDQFCTNEPITSIPESKTDEKYKHMNCVWSAFIGCHWVDNKK